MFARIAQALSSLAESIEHEKESIGRCHEKLRAHALSAEALSHAERDASKVLQLVADVEAEEARVDAMGKEHDSCRTQLKANDAALHDATFKEHQFKRQIGSIQERTARMHKQHASRKEAAEEGMETASKEWEEVNAERAVTEEQLNASELQLRAESEKVRESGASPAPRRPPAPRGSPPDRPPSRAPRPAPPLARPEQMQRVRAQHESEMAHIQLKRERLVQQVSSYHAQLLTSIRAS